MDARSNPAAAIDFPILLKMNTSLYLSTDFLLWLLFTVFIILIWKFSQNSEPNLPPGPKPWPIIGNLNLLAQKLPYRTFAKLSSKYGPLLYLKLGSHPAIVASSAKWAKEILQTHDKEFGNRPDNEISRGPAFGSIAFTPTGDYWRQMRKITILEVFSPKKIQANQGLRLEEIRKAIAKIGLEKGQPVVVHKLTEGIVAGFMGRVLFSSSVPDHIEKLKRVLEEFNNNSSGIIIAEFLPYLSFFDVLIRWGLAKFQDAKRLVHQVFTIRRSRNGDQLQPECFLDVLLTLQQQPHYLVDNGDTALHGVLLDLFAAGIDTTSTTVEWAMAELMRHPEKLKKVREEMDRELMRSKRNINYDDVLEDKELRRLKYLDAVVKETLRLHPPAPLLLPRQSMEKCVLGEYEVPKGTIVFINAWGVGQDPELWEKPQEFFPERFSAYDDKESTTWLEQGLLSFGGGQRGCPGKALGLSTAKLVLANLLYFFDWNMGIDNPTLVDMVEKYGIAVMKKNIPLMVIPTPRNQNGL